MGFQKDKEILESIDRKKYKPIIILFSDGADQKQEDTIKTLVKELFALDTLHQEYQDNDTHFVIDSEKEGDTLTIKVQLIKNKDKEEFEKWLENIDDDFFSEVLNELSEEGLQDLEEIYNSSDYKIVIDKVKAKSRELANRKIIELKKLLG